MDQNYKVLNQSLWEAAELSYEDPKTSLKNEFAVKGYLSCEYDATIYDETKGSIQGQIFPKIKDAFKAFIELQTIKQKFEYGRSFENFQEYLKSDEFSSVMSSRMNETTQKLGLRNWNISVKEFVVVEKVVEVQVIDTSSDKKDGQNKCPKCGATDISVNVNNGNLRCNFCRFEFQPEKLEILETDISSLEGQVITSSAQDIVADTNEIMTFKCSSCGAEVVIDTSEQLQARCHWCRNTLSINQQIPNGAVPDVVLPFTLSKDGARGEIEKFVKKRKFFANPVFKKEFTTENIMGVYLPYMIVDINAHSNLSGQGEVLIRKYVRRSGDSTKTYYDADLYNVQREFDIQIDGLTVESNVEKLSNSSAKTNNVINAIMPFDLENCVKWNANYLKGYTSEKRDVNIDGLKDLVAVQAKDVARYKANETLVTYDRGVRWDNETLEIKGQRWKTAYLPVWLYSYQQKSNNKLHYVAVNARTKETMGSVPIHMPKLCIFSFLAEILGFLAMLFIDFDYDFLFLLSGFVFFFVFYSKYRNQKARHNHEKDTKSQMGNVRKYDQLIDNKRGLTNSKMIGANNESVNGAGFNKNNLLKK